MNHNFENTSSYCPIRQSKLEVFLFSPDQLMIISGVFRLMGLTPFVNVDCNTYPTQLVLNAGITWSEFISPPLNLVLHWMLGWGVVVFISSDKVSVSN